MTLDITRLNFLILEMRKLRPEKSKWPKVTE